jgi:hypothetical protein
MLHRSVKGPRTEEVRGPFGLVAFRDGMEWSLKPNSLLTRQAEYAIICAC